MSKTTTVYTVGGTEYAFEIWSNGTPATVLVAHYNHGGETFSIWTAESDALPCSQEDADIKINELAWATEEMSTLRDAGYEPIGDSATPEAPAPARVVVSKPWGSYNGRRYGTPWAARITAFTGRPVLDFIKGAYNGNDSGGELVITGTVGEIIKIGQKDYRGNKTDNDFYRITETGELELVESPVEARQLWLQHAASK